MVVRSDEFRDEPACVRSSEAPTKVQRGPFRPIGEERISFTNEPGHLVWRLLPAIEPVDVGTCLGVPVGGKWLRSDHAVVPGAFGDRYETAVGLFDASGYRSPDNCNPTVNRPVNLGKATKIST